MNIFTWISFLFFSSRPHFVFQKINHRFSVKQRNTLGIKWPSVDRCHLVFVSANHGWFSSVVSIHTEILPHFGHSQRSAIKLIQLSKSVCHIMLRTKWRLSFGVSSVQSKHCLRIWRSRLFIHFTIMHFIHFVCSNVANAERFKIDCEFRRIHWKK